MFLKLIIYEFKKMFHSRFAVISVLILLGLEIALSCKDWKSYGSQRSVVKNMRMTSDIIADMNDLERGAFVESMKELYGINVFEEIPAENTRIYTIPGYLGDEIPDFTAILAYQAYINENRAIEEAVERTISLAKLLGRDALKKNDNFNIRRNLRIIRLYSITRPMVSGYIHGIDEFSCNSEITMLPVILVVFLLTATMFSKEQQTQTYILILSTDKGYRHTAEAKYMTSILMALIITVVFQCFSFSTSGLNEGFSSLSDNITAIPEMRLCPFVLSVRCYLGLLLLARCTVSVFAAILFSTCSIMVKKDIMSYVFCAPVLMIFLWYVFIPDQSFLWNPCSMISLNRFLSSYNVINLLGFPILKLLIILLLQIIICACMMFLGMRVYIIGKRKV